MPPSRQEESREWLLLPESLTDEALRERRVRRRHRLIRVVVLWLVMMAAWWFAPVLGALLTQAIILLAPVAPGIWVGYRAQTPYARRHLRRPFSWAIPMVFLVSFAWLGLTAAFNIPPTGPPTLWVLASEALAGLTCLGLPLYLVGSILGRWWFVLTFNLTGADLSHRELADLELAGMRLSRVDFSRSNLDRVHFQYTDLRQASFRDACLRETRFYHAHLRGVDFATADLRDADLSRAILREADLAGADLRGANLTGAILADAQLEGALYNDETRWPVGFDPDDHGVIRVDSAIAPEDPNPA